MKEVFNGPIYFQLGKMVLSVFNTKTDSRGTSQTIDVSGNENSANRQKLKCDDLKLVS